MPVYVYEVIGSEGDIFEVRQSIHDSPLRTHPEDGRPVRRVITGGLGFLKVRSGPTRPPAGDSSSHCCPGCHD